MRLQFLRDIYWELYKRYWITLAKTNPRTATIKWYEKRMGRKPDLENPQLLTEKLQYLKINDYFNNSIVRQCADKYAVREYVKSKGCGEILNELYSVYKNVSEINWGGAGQLCA